MNAPIASPYVDTIPAIPMRDVLAETILGCVASAYRMSVEMLTGERKHGRLPEARAVAIWLLRTRTPMSFSLIGELLNRDHSTVCKAMESLIRKRTKDSTLDNFIEQLSAAVDARLQ